MLSVGVSSLNEDQAGTIAASSKLSMNASFGVSTLVPAPAHTLVDAGGVLVPPLPLAPPLPLLDPLLLVEPPPLLDPLLLDPPPLDPPLLVEPPLEEPLLLLAPPLLLEPPPPGFRMLVASATWQFARSLDA